MIKKIVLILILVSNIAYAGESGDKNKINTNSQNIKEDDPFSKDITKELAKRQYFSSLSFYPLDTLRLVATLQVPDNESIKKFRDEILKNHKLKLDDLSKNLNAISNRFVRNLAIIELPENNDQVIIYEGQIIGKNKAIIHAINKNEVVILEKNNKIVLELSK